MGVLDIFRHKKEIHIINPPKNYQIKNTKSGIIIRTRPTKEFRIRKCHACGKKVKHVIIHEKTIDQDLGGMENRMKVWAITYHKFKDRKCRGSGRRYKTSGWK